MFSRESFMKWTETAFRMTAVAAAVSAVFWWFVEPRITPLLALPQEVAKMQDKLDKLALEERAIVDFVGSGVVRDSTVKRGGQISVTYVLRRNVACNTDVLVRFFSIYDNTYTVNRERVPAVRAPVSRDYGIFTVKVRVPATLHPGLYVYHPELIPIDCGVYRQPAVPLTNVFAVE